MICRRMASDVDVLGAIEGAWDLVRGLEPAADRVTPADLTRVRAAVAAMAAARAEGEERLGATDRGAARTAAMSVHARAAAVAMAGGDVLTARTWLQAALDDCTDPAQAELLRAAQDDPESYRGLVHVRYLVARGETSTAKVIAQRLLRRSAEPLTAALERALDGPRPVGRGGPTLWRFNGCGLGFYGKRDRGVDGSYVTTHCVSFVWLPLIPIGAYRVIDADGGYHVLARVGLSAFARWARLAMIAAIVLTAAGVGLHRHLNDPRRLAGKRFDAAVAAAAGGDRARALARLEAELTGPDYDRVGAARRQRAAAALVRLTAAEVPSPFTAASLDQARRLVRRYQALPVGALGGEALTALLDVFDGWRAALTDPADRLALLREASALVRAVEDNPRLIALARALDEARVAFARARAEADPVEALAVLVEPPRSPATIAAARPLVEALVASPSLVDDAGLELEDWLAAAPSADPLRGEAVSARERGAAGRAEAEADDVKVAALTAMQAARPWDQRVALALARADLDAGHLDRAAARLTAFGAPGRLVRDARLVLARIAAARGQLDEADRLLAGMLTGRLARFTAAVGELDRAARAARERISARLEGGDVPASLATQLDGVGDDDRKRELVLAWAAAQVDADVQVAALQPRALALSDVVPAALALGSIKLRRAGAATDEAARDLLLREAEATFLSVQLAAAGDVEYELGLGEIYARLGKTAESEAAFAAVLAKGDDGLRLQVAHTYRELGNDTRAREVATEVEGKAPPALRKRAALLLALLARDEDEAEGWYRKADPTEVGVRAALLEIEGRRAVRRGDDAACAARFAEAARLQLSTASADNVAGYNNAALSYQQAFGCTGDPTRFAEAVRSLERAYRAAPGISMLVANLAEIQREQAALRVVGRQLALKELRLGADHVLALAEVLADGPEGDRVRAALRAEPSWRRADELAAELEVLAPSRAGSWQLRFDGARVAGDAAAATAVIERARTRAIDSSAADHARAQAASGAGDERARESARSMVAQMERLTAGSKLDQRSRAIAWLVLGQGRLALAMLDRDAALAASGRVAVAEADRLWPALGQASAVISAMIDEAGLSGPSGERWARDRRGAEALELLDRLIAAGDPIGAAIRARVPWEQVRALALADASRPGLFELRLARRLADDTLAARVAAARSDPMVRLAFELNAVLDPGDPSIAADRALLDGR